MNLINDLIDRLRIQQTNQVKAEAVSFPHLEPLE